MRHRPRGLVAPGFFMPTELSTKPKSRVVFLVDGFNLYHAIDDCPQFHGCKWLDLQALARAYTMPSTEMVVAVFFFTALPTWNEAKRARHQQLLDIYQDQGVIVKPGLFKRTTATCRVCGKDYPTFAEKLTDINICIELLRMGSDDIADKIFLITGDNDQAAAITRFRELHPTKEVIAILPPFRKAAELQQAASSSRTITKIQLGRSILPNPYRFRDGIRSYPKPSAWVDSPPPAGWTFRCEHRPTY